MSKNKSTTEQIISKLREAEVLQSNGQCITEKCCHLDKRNRLITGVKRIWRNAGRSGKAIKRSGTRKHKTKKTCMRSIPG